jgi:hypothetical protein
VVLAKVRSSVARAAQLPLTLAINMINEGVCIGKQRVLTVKAKLKAPYRYATIDLIEVHSPFRYAALPHSPLCLLSLVLTVCRD